MIEDLTNVDISTLSEDELDELERLVEQLEHDKKYNRIQFFEPYPWQRSFIDATKDNNQLLACCGNRTGKTFTGAALMVHALTGEYPEDYKGRVWDKPINAWVSGISTITTRDILQSELFGDSKRFPDSLGEGAIPKDNIIAFTRKQGTPNCIESAQIRHKSGGMSTVAFKSYEMGQDSYMGTSMDLIWLDEEAPKAIYTQCATRTATTSGIVYMTFTPEHGLTEVVDEFFHNIQDGQFLIQATWDDCPHLDEATKKQLLSVYSEAERKMRSEGIPSLGSGVCFPILDEQISCSPFAIPSDWKRIIGVDLGFDHPNGAVGVARDPNNGTIYVYSERSEKNENLIIHAAGIKALGGDRIPVIFPHDAFKRDGSNTGQQFIQLYRDQGVKAHPTPFSNPSPDGKFNNSVEVGVWEMLRMMEAGQLKVFDTCAKFFREKAGYHRKDGKIIDRKDDVLSSARYAIMSVERYGQTVDTASSDSGYYLPTHGDVSPAWMNDIV